MTFREKHLWISIVSTVVIWGVYYWRFGERVLEGAGKVLTTNANAMVVIANILLFAIILSEMIRFVFTVVLLRRGR